MGSNSTKFAQGSRDRDITMTTRREARDRVSYGT
ncbi:hypothetical protein NK6_421 [Bradyrhizobium diazoefficiens]|uniref:Uncharacterized protein n=1 Tax=Bradyrhizobium diazoefficiens TaxID=1355477 RepID=A0A0E4FQ75_9BRAD|nr:hypothetical protein NK6_421 [Bradyrhizobium diazoefficiens]